MPGKGDAVDAQPAAATDFHVDDRERDRDAGAPLDHLVEEAVLRVVIVGLVAGETELVEQHGIEPPHPPLRKRPCGEPARHLRGKFIERSHVPRLIEIRILLARDG